MGKANGGLPFGRGSTCPFQGVKGQHVPMIWPLQSMAVGPPSESGSTKRCWAKWWTSGRPTRAPFTGPELGFVSEVDVFFLVCFNGKSKNICWSGFVETQRNQPFAAPRALTICGPELRTPFGGHHPSDCHQVIGRYHPVRRNCIHFAQDGTYSSI